ncbi:MAG: flagellar hook-basal body complex protein FliE [Candidatus Zixiibacteriota bacterium]
MNPLDPIGPIMLPGASGEAPAVSTPKPTSDAQRPGNVFGDLLDQVSELQSQASALENRLLSGEDVELHRVMIAAEEAGTAFELLVEMRNRLVEAYQELMRMPV